MLVRRSVQQLDAARASSPRICADCTRVTADVRAAAHLSEMAAGPEAAHPPEAAVHLVTAAHPREPERAAAAGRTQPGTSSHRRQGAVLRSQIHQAGEGSVQVSREDETEPGDHARGREQPSRSEVRRGRTGAGCGKLTEEGVSCVATGRMLEEDARLQMPSPGY